MSSFSPAWPVLKVGLAALLGIAQVGCGSQSVTAVARVDLGAATAAEIDATARTLQARFDAVRPSWASRCAVTVIASTIELEFRGVAPNDDEIRYYASAPGVFRISPHRAKHMVIVSDLDVEDISFSETPDGPGVNWTLTEAGGTRMLEYTSRNVGTALITTWDGKEISVATIRGVFSRQFQTTGIDLETARRMQNVLRHGRLPAAVHAVKIAHAAA